MQQAAYSSRRGEKPPAANSFQHLFRVVGWPPATAGETRTRIRPKREEPWGELCEKEGSCKGVDPDAADRRGIFPEAGAFAEDAGDFSPQQEVVGPFEQDFTAEREGKGPAGPQFRTKMGSICIR